MNSPTILSNAAFSMYKSSLQLKTTANNIAKGDSPTYNKIQNKDTMREASPICDNLRKNKDIKPKQVDEVVNLINIQHSYTANARVVKTTEVLIGSLLDTIA